MLKAVRYMTKIDVLKRLIGVVLRVTLAFTLLWTSTFLHDMGGLVWNHQDPSVSSVVESNTCSADRQSHFHEAMALANRPCLADRSSLASLPGSTRLCCWRTDAVNLYKQTPRPPPTGVSRKCPLYLLKRTLVI